MNGSTAKGVCVVLHDVAPTTWNIYSDFVAAIDEIGNVPLTLLVVPNYHNSGQFSACHDFCKVLDTRVKLGDELVLHGYFHEDTLPLSWSSPRELFMRRVFTHEGEFYSLGEKAARFCLERGLEMFQERNWPVNGFVAPAWLMGAGARRALTNTSLKYCSDPGSLLQLPDFSKIPAPTLVWSSGSWWRRRISYFWNEHRRYRHREAGLLRLGLHPIDMQHPEVFDYWLKTLKKLLQSRAAMTKSTWLGFN